MTDLPEETPEPIFDQYVGLKDAVPHDFVLDFLLRLTLPNTGVDLEADVPDQGFAITLSTRGLLVSGRVISRAAWVKYLADGMGSSNKPELVSTLGEALKDMDDSIREGRAARIAEGKAVRPQGLLHLKDAVLYTGSGMRSVSLWRTRIEDIEGWTLGKFQEYEGTEL